MPQQFDLLINTYLDSKVGVAPQFLTKALSQGLQQNIHQLQKDNLMANASIGNDELKDPNQKMRSDKIYWLDKKHNNPFENEFLQRVEDFIAYLNETCYAGINAYEFHYAVYEKGTFYKRHKDQFKSNNNRKYSLVTYLNDNWVEADGGQLQVYGDNSMQQIQPHAQTAVLFKSDETEHEVLIANQSRMSITGWLKQV
jgi:Rps23 Pro-64 3,4-dihydroxylase Tpa1-like proline 4-hydroxylase